MPRARILIVDDSVVMRRWLTDALSRDPRLEVAGSAANGRIALMKIPLLRPDVVLLDIEMAGADVLGILAAILKAHPLLPVVMINVPTEQGAAATLDALAVGAKDYVTKPDISSSSDDALRNLRDELASKIMALCPNSAEKLSSDSLVLNPVGTSALNTIASRLAKRVDVVAIGASIGGPNALMDIIPQFPSDFPVPILIVQHIPPILSKLLAERLAARCKVRVAEGSLHQILLPGSAWIAPGNLHMTVERELKTVRIRTSQGPSENSCRPAVDVLFRSVAEVYGAHSLVVVMTGMGQDGLRGCQQIRAVGGQVLAQDEASSVVWGMPKAVVETGIADQILPLSELGPEIISRVMKHRLEQHAAVEL